VARRARLPGQLRGLDAAAEGGLRPSPPRLRLPGGPARPGLRRTDHRRTALLLQPGGPDRSLDRDVLEAGRRRLRGLRGSARPGRVLPAADDAPRAPDVGLTPPRRPAVAAAGGCPRRRAQPSIGPRPGSRLHDVGRRPARRPFRARGAEGLDRVDRRGRGLGRSAHPRHRLQPAASRARRDRRDLGRMGPGDRRHGRDQPGARALRRGLRRRDPNRRASRRDRRPRELRRRGHARRRRGDPSADRRLGRPSQDDDPRPRGGRALPRRGLPRHAPLPNPGRLGEGQPSPRRAAALRGCQRRPAAHAGAHRGQPLPLDRLPRASLAGRARRQARRRAVRGGGASLSGRLKPHRRRALGDDDVHPVRPARRGWMGERRPGALRGCLRRAPRPPCAERARGDPRARGARAAGPRADLRPGRWLDLPGRTGAGPDGVHAPLPAPRPVLDPARRALPLRRRDPPRGRGDGRIGPQRRQADPSRSPLQRPSPAIRALPERAPRRRSERGAPASASLRPGFRTG
jgi:hypothetical protein